MKHCQQCNLDFLDSFRFCGSCGGSLPDSLTCQGCGDLVESKWTFCTNCGKQLSSQSISEAAQANINVKTPLTIVAGIERLSVPLKLSASRFAVMLADDGIIHSSVFKATSQEGFELRVVQIRRPNDFAILAD